MAKKGVGIILSKSTIERAEPGSSIKILWDKYRPGFGVCVTPKGGKSWYVAGRIGRGREARSYSISLGAVDFRQSPDEMAETIRAKRKEAEAILEKAAKDGVDPRKPAVEAERLTFEAVAAAFFDREEDRIEAGHTEAYAPKTLAEMQISRRAQLVPAFGHLAIESVDREAVKTWFDERKASHPTSANRELSCLSAVMRYAMERRYVSANPCLGQARAKERRRLSHLKEGDIKRLMRALDAHEEAYLADLEARKARKKARLARLTARGEEKTTADKEEIDERKFVAAIKILLRTGLRMNELCTLQWFDTGRGNYVDWHSKRINFREHKTSRKASVQQMEVPLDDGTIKLLQPLLPPQRENPYIMWRPGKRHWTVRMLEDRWNDIAKKLGLPPGTTLYATRHTFGTQAVKAADPMVVQQKMKHASFATTEIYIHLAAEDVEEGTKDIGGAFDKIMG